MTNEPKNDGGTESVLPEGQFTPEFSKLLDDFHAQIAKRYERPQELPPTEPLTEEKKNALKTQLAEIMGPMDEETRKIVGKIVYVLVRCLYEDMEPMKSYAKVDKYLRVLLGDAYFNHLPNAWDPSLFASEAEKIFSTGSLDNLFYALEAKKKQPKTESWRETVLPTLDMIFAQRYGWGPGIANKMTITEMCIALENAIEYDDPQKPSVWDMTKGIP